MLPLLHNCHTDSLSGRLPSDGHTLFYRRRQSWQKDTLCIPVKMNYYLNLVKIQNHDFIQNQLVINILFIRFTVNNKFKQMKNLILLVMLFCGFTANAQWGLNGNSISSSDYLGSTKGKSVIDLSSFPSSVYIIQIIQGGIVENNKVVIGK